MEEIRKIIREVLEEQSREQRYVANMEFYVYANDDKDAVNKSKALASDMNMNFDNQASITSLSKQSFGTLGSKPLDL